MFARLKKIFHKNFLRRKYYRKGSCNGCGACCTHIYVRHLSNVIKDEKLFNKLRYINHFYSGLEVIGSDEIGLIFKCTNLDEVTKKCKVHKKRANICRKYPQEEIFIMGGELGEKCGYSFSPIESFDEVFERTKRHCKP